MIADDKDRIAAKCYAVYGSHKYYRTDDGETFCVNSEKYFFYFGNVKKGDEHCEYLIGERLESIKKRFSFVDF